MAKQNSPVSNAMAVTDRTTKALTTAATNVEKTVGTSVTSLQKAVDEITKAISTQSETLAEVTYDVEVKSAELDSLSDKLQQRRREAEADLAIALKESKETTISKALGELNKVAVSTEDLSRLRIAASANEEELQKAVSKAAAAASEKGKEEGTRLAEQAQNEAALNAATLKAEKQSLQDRLTAAQDTITDLRTQITAEREARVKEAEARGKSMVTVNSSK